MRTHWVGQQSAGLELKCFVAQTVCLGGTAAVLAARSHNGYMAASLHWFAVCQLMFPVAQVGRSRYGSRAQHASSDRQ